MSFEAMKWATEQKLPAMQKIVLLMLANRADNKGLCFPSHDTLAIDCGMAKRSVIYQIAELEKSGLITVLREVKNGVKSVNKYKINSESLALPSESLALPSESLALGDSASLAHEPINIEPIIEPSFSFLSDSEKNEKLSEEMQGCYDWAINQNWWKERITDINKFLHFYGSNSVNGLKAQFQQAQKNREATTNNTHGSLTNKNQGANYVTRTKTKQPDYSNPEYYRGTDASF